MTSEMLIVFAILLVTVILFASDRLRMDIIAVMAILALMITGSLTPNEALAGFGDPLVILIAGLFVVGEGLFRTGIAFTVGNWLIRVAGSNKTRLLIMLMLVVAVLSAFMSNTGAVAIFIPIALNLAAHADIPPARLLLPMAYAGSIGGMLTLIGSPPNLVVSTELTRAGLEPFHFFSFLPIGLLILIAAIAFILLVGPRLLPRNIDDEEGRAPGRMSLSDLVQAYGIGDRFHRVRLELDTPLVGTTVAKARLRSQFGVTVLAIERSQHGKTVVKPVLHQSEYEAGDILFMEGSEAEVQQLLVSIRGLVLLPVEDSRRDIIARELGLAEILLPPRSELNGHTIREARFREDHGLSVLGILRKGKPLQESLLDSRLEFGDTLLVAGGWRQVDLLQRELNNFMVLTLPQEMDEVAPYRERAPLALAIVGIMLGLMTFDVLPAVVAVLLAGVAMVLARCVTMEEAYKAINWQSVVLIAGMLPMATALDKTGALDLIVTNLVSGLGDKGPTALMAGLFLLTAVFSQFISNTATAVLVAPIAVGAATSLGISPYPLLMAVALAASTAFSTPMASPVNTLVIGPGGYRFMDFVKLGVPLQILAMVISLIFVPLLFPF